MAFGGQERREQTAASQPGQRGGDRGTLARLADRLVNWTHPGASLTHRHVDAVRRLLREKRQGRQR